MNRRTFFATVSTFALASVALAQEAKEGGKAKAPKRDRLSGRVMSIDKNAMSIEMHTNSNPNVRRTIKYTADTKITEAAKPSSLDALKDGMRIVAVGKFDGPVLNATQINIIPRP